jgi:hypothetical protein
MSISWHTAVSPLVRERSTVQSCPAAPVVSRFGCNNPFVTRMTRLAGAKRSIAHGLGRVEPEGSTAVAYTARHDTTAMMARRAATAPSAKPGSATSRNRHQYLRWKIKRCISCDSTGATPLPIKSLSMKITGSTRSPAIRSLKRPRASVTTDAPMFRNNLSRRRQWPPSAIPGVFSESR